MDVVFTPMAPAHQCQVIDIFNYYIEHSYAAYFEEPVPYAAYDQFLALTKGYPAYVIEQAGTVKGFCFLHAYNPLPVFRETAEVSYFLAPDATGCGLGAMALQRLEHDARKMGLSRLLASISSENAQSLAFHRKHGFTECGRFPQIGKKWGKAFDVVWMEKSLVG